MKYICNIIDKNFYKSNPTEKATIRKGLSKLLKQIKSLEDAGVKFEDQSGSASNGNLNIHDSYGNGFYAYKFSGLDKTSVRMLFRFARHEDSINIELHKHIFKKGGSKKSSYGTEYIKEFERYAEQYTEECV